MNRHGFGLLNLCMEHYGFRIRNPGPELILDTYIAYIYLSDELPDLALVFLRYLVELVTTVLPLAHPIRILWSTSKFQDLFQHRGYLRIMVDLVFDLCHGLVTDRHSISAVPNTLLCLDHLHGLGLLSYGDYCFRYRTCFDLLIPSFSRHEDTTWSALALKEALSRQDWTAADSQVQAAEDWFYKSNQDVTVLFEDILPMIEIYGDEVGLQIDIQLSRVSPSATVNLGIPLSDQHDADWESHHLPVEPVAQRSSALFRVHYAELANRTCELLRYGIRQSQPRTQEMDQPSTHLACSCICHEGSRYQCYTGSEPHSDDPPTAPYAPGKPQHGKVHLMSWLLYWLFHGALRPNKLIGRQSRKDIEVSSSSNIDAWIQSHFFPVDQYSRSKAPIKYFAATVTHHVQGSAFQTIGPGP